MTEINSDVNDSGPSVQSESVFLFICRDRYETFLAEEVTFRLNECWGGPKGLTIAVEPGLIKITGQATTEFSRDFKAPMIFERQRLWPAVFLPQESLKQTARHVCRMLLPVITESEALWTLHSFATQQDSEQHLVRRIQRIGETVLDFCKERFPLVYRRYVKPLSVIRNAENYVLQLCLAGSGLWGAVMKSDHLTDPYPGGLHRVGFDPNAPSRSYMKLEEVFSLMGEEPRPRQTVVDLGAAPGGWSYACLKRGCHVMAVDHGPMKINMTGEMKGRMTHLREDGMSFSPTQIRGLVDWLVSDMLVPPGKSLGLLKRWIENQWMKRFVITIKLPQQQPYPVIQPIEQYLRSFPEISFHIRHLYHDRREVTLFGKRIV